MHLKYLLSIISYLYSIISYLNCKAFHKVIRAANTNFVLCAFCFVLCSLDLKSKRRLNHRLLFKSPNTPDLPAHRHPGIYQKSE